MFSAGYAGLSLRSVAKKCNLSVGTIYNHYDSKDHLIASIMMEDWFIALQRMEQGCQDAPTIAAGVRAIYEAVHTFSCIYAEVWAQFSSTSGAAKVVDSRHFMIREQLSKPLCVLLVRLSHEEDLRLVPLLSETILAAVMQKDISCDDIMVFSQRLFAHSEA